MPLRYLEPSQSQYVPQYTPLSEQAIYSTAGTHAQQSQAGLDYLDQMSMAQQEMLGSMTGLSGEHQAQASSLFDEARLGMEEHVEQHGARGARQAINRQAREFGERIKPYHQRSATVNQQLQRLETAVQDRELDHQVKNFLQTSLMEANNSTDINEQLEVDRYFGIVDNYTSYRKWAEEMKGLMTSRGTQTVSIDEFPDSMQRIIEASGRSASEINMSLVQEAMNDNQIRSQLELDLIMKHGRDVDFAEKVPFHIRDEEGNTISTQEMSLLQKEAIERFTPFSTLMGNYAEQHKFKQFRERIGGQDYLDLTPTLVDINPEIRTVSKWYENINEELIGYNQTLNSEFEYLKNQYGLDIHQTEDNQLMFTDEQGNERLFSDYVTELERNGDLRAGSFREPLIVYESARARVNHLNYTIDTHHDRLRSELAKNPGFEEFADIIEFDRKTGKFLFGEGFDALLTKQGIENILGRETTKIDRGNFANNLLEQIEDNTIFTTSVPVLQYTGQHAEYVMRDNQHILRIGNDLYNVTNNPILKQITDIINFENKSIEEELSAPRQGFGFQLSWENDRDVIESFMREIESTRDALVDKDGNLVKNSFGMVPQRITLAGGRPTLTGAALDEKNVRTQDNVRFTGASVEAHARRRYGENYGFVMRTEQIQQFLSPMLIRGGNTGSEIEPAILRDWFGENAFKGKPVRIDIHRGVTGGNRDLRYRVQVGDVQSTFRDIELVTRFLQQQNINIQTGE